MKKKKKTTQKIFSVYGLFNPFEPDIVRYIGITKNPINTRLRQHIWHAKKGRAAPVFAWIRELLDIGILPEIRPLNVTHKEEEARMIELVRIRDHADTVKNKICPLAPIRYFHATNIKIPLLHISATDPLTIRLHDATLRTSTTEANHE